MYFPAFGSFDLSYVSYVRSTAAVLLGRGAHFGQMVGPQLGVVPQPGLVVPTLMDTDGNHLLLETMEIPSC